MILKKLLENSTIDPKVRAEIVSIMRDAKIQVQRLIEGASGKADKLFDPHSLNQLIDEIAELRSELQRLWVWSHDAEYSNGDDANCDGVILDGRCMGTRDGPCQFPRPAILGGKSC